MGSMLGEDIYERNIKPLVEHNRIDRKRGFVGDLKSTAELPFDLMRALNTGPDALFEKPIGETAAKIPAYKAGPDGKLTRRDPKEVEETFRDTAAQALGSVRAGGKLNKLPDFGPGFAKPRSFLKRPAPAAKVEPTAPTYGAEKPRVERLDNALNRTRGHHTADKLEILEAIKKIPRAARDPKLQEQLYHELEQGLVNPARKLSAEAEEALGHFKGYYHEQTDLMNWIRKFGAQKGHDVEEYLHDQGYVARRAEGHSPMFDDSLAPTRDPITGKGSVLNKRTTAMNARAQHRVLQKGKETVFVPSDQVAEDAAKYRIGAKVTGSKGKVYTVRQPTTAEIEANTKVRYHKNALTNTLDNVVRLRQVRRNLETLDAALEDLKSAGLAHRERWSRPLKEGGKNGGPPLMVEQRNPKPTPEHMVGLNPDVFPQVKGWKFDPKIAEVFKDYRPEPGHPAWEALGKLNGALTSTLFWNPLPHVWNVGNHWAVARGWDWATPAGWASLARNGSRAIHAVMTQNEDYRNMLREGSGLQSGDIEARNFHEVMFRKGLSEITRDGHALSTLMHSFKLHGISPQQVIGAIYKASSKALWRANDVLLLQRQYELADKGMAARSAIHEAEKDIPNYRIPSRVLHDSKTGRVISDALRDPNLAMFGRYRYGQIKAWGTMFHDLYQGSAEERTEAAGRFLVAAIIAGGVYPMLDKGVQKLTGSKEARVHRGGGFTIPDAAAQMEKGQKGWLGFMSSIAALPPATERVLQAPTNRDAFGRRIVEPDSTHAEKAAEIGEYVAGSVNPLQTAIEASKPDGARRSAARAAMVDWPADDAAKKRKVAESFNKRDAQRRRKKDPLVKAASELFP